MDTVFNFYGKAACTTFLIVATILFLSGCGTTHFGADNSPRTASDLPDYFLIGSHSDTYTSEPKPDEGCRNPMVDPLDGTKLELVRSNGEHGDYKVSDGRYGVGRRDLLRIECSTGRAVGIVRK